MYFLTSYVLVNVEKSSKSLEDSVLSPEITDWLEFCLRVKFSIRETEGEYNLKSILTEHNVIFEKTGF